MTFSWIIFLLVAMVHTRATNKLKRAKKPFRKGEFIQIEGSESEPEKEDDVDWDELMNEEVTPAKTTQKTSDTSKGKTATDKGKAPMTPPTISMKRKRLARRFGLSQDTNVDTTIAPDSPPHAEEVFIHNDRLRAFAHRECIGERHVNVEALRGHSPEFGVLIEQANLLQICRFPETLGYCLHHVRTFYTNARHLREFENGPMEFYTNIQGTRFKITPHLIGEVLGMEASKTGVNYLKGVNLTNTLWRKVIEGICIEGTESTGKSVRSKELRLEYRFLNFITCYNILPNMQTKVVRWDRLLFLYLTGHPSEATALNINIPYIIWNRMARYVEHPHPTERIPFPLIIMRLLKKFQVDITSTTYHQCLSMIDESTIVKSLHKLPHVTPAPTSGTRPGTSTAASPSRQAPGTDDEVSLTSLVKEQQRLSVKQDQILRAQQRISNELEIVTAAQITITKRVKKMFYKMGCTSSDDSDSEE